MEPSMTLFFYPHIPVKSRVFSSCHVSRFDMRHHSQSTGLRKRARHRKTVSSPSAYVESYFCASIFERRNSRKSCSSSMSLLKCSRYGANFLRSKLIRLEAVGIFLSVRASLHADRTASISAEGGGHFCTMRCITVFVSRLPAVALI